MELPDKSWVSLNVPLVFIFDFVQRPYSKVSHSILSFDDK